MRLTAHLVAVASVFFVLVAGGCVSDDGANGDGGLPDTGGPGAKKNGDLCGTGGECSSGFCTDGVCCDKACNGQCESCTGSTKGTCAPVTGNPIAPRQACTGTGSLCGGTCDGKSSNCAFPPASTICGGSCTGTCDGAGTCSDKGTGTCPNGFACGAGKCLTTCTGNQDCQPNFNCDTGTNTCNRIPESDCLDGQDNNGDGLADCADPTCVNLTVQCVPSVGNGATIGTVVPQLPCPAGFGSSTPMYQNINSGTCSGCSCQTQCNATITYFAGANCSGGSSDQEMYFNGTNGVTTSCKNNTDFNAASGQVTSLTRGTCLGSGSAVWTASNPVFANSDVFCGVTSTSNTCGQNQICVPKPTGTLAAKVASTSACPSGYVGTQSTFYTTYTNGSCPVCTSCNASTTVSCGIIGLGHYTANDNTCNGASKLPSGNTNTNTNCVDFGATYTIYSTNADWLIGTIASDTCTNNKTPTAPTPTGGQLVCNVQ
jgi:hypothetical protein